MKRKWAFSMDVIGEVSVVQISGKLDTEAMPEVKLRLEQILESGAEKILIDFENLDYISSSGLRLLIIATKRLAPVNGQLRVCNLNSVVREVFDISGLTKIIPVSQSKAQAIDEF